MLGIVACLIGCQKSDNYELMKESKQQVLPIYEKKDAEVQGEKCALETLQDVYKSDYILEEWKIEKIGEPGGIFCNDEAVLISDKKTDCIFEVDYAGNILKEVDEVIEQIKEKDNHADILGVTEGEELYKNALYTKIQWRIVRGMCALVAILFFMINETIVLMAKAKKERKIMGINLALGATERDIKYCLFFETLLVTLLAVFLVMITLRPLAKLASLEHIIILDSMVIVETVILAVWACEILTWIIVSRIKKENIADMVRTTRDI